jgi:glycosyltransferase involved in cell wall biosynthesis
VKIRSNPTLLSLFLLDPFKIGGMEVFARELSRQLGSEGWDSALCFNAKAKGKVRAFLELPNVRLYSLPERSTNLLHAGDFLECLRAVKPRIVHLHFTGIVSMLPWLAYCGGATKIFYTDHESRHAGGYKKLPVYKRWAAQIITWPVTNQIAVSKHVSSRAETEGYISRKKLIQIYNGVDSTRIGSAEAGTSFRNRLGIPADRFIVMQVGSLIPEKGCRLLISALAMAVPKNPLLHGVLVGEGPQEPELKELAEQLGVKEHVTFAGSSVDPFGEGVFAAADVVCCLPVWEEAFGFTLAEALAHGKPVVATSAGAIPEIVQDGITGLLVAKNDVASLAGRVLQLAADSELRSRIGRAAQQAVRERFELSDRVSELLQAYGVKLNATPTMVETAEPELLRASR